MSSIEVFNALTLIDESLGKITGLFKKLPQIIDNDDKAIRRMNFDEISKSSQVKSSIASAIEIYAEKIRSECLLVLSSLGIANNRGTLAGAENSSSVPNSLTGFCDSIREYYLREAAKSDAAEFISEQKTLAAVTSIERSVEEFKAVKEKLERKVAVNKILVEDRLKHFSNSINFWKGMQKELDDGYTAGGKNGLFKMKTNQNKDHMIIEAKA